MAECVVVGKQLEVKPSTKERLEAVHSDVGVPLSSVRSVEVVENTLDHVHGLRIGTGIPGSTAIGTFSPSSATIFDVIHHGKHRGLRIILECADFDEMLIGCDPEAVASSIPVNS